MFRDLAFGTGAAWWGMERGSPGKGREEGDTPSPLPVLGSGAARCQLVWPHAAPALHPQTPLPTPLTELLREQDLPLPNIKGISFGQARMEPSEVNAGKGAR